MIRYIRASESAYQLVMREENLNKAKKILEENGIWAKIGKWGDEKVLVVHDDGLEFLYYDCEPRIPFTEAGFWNPKNPVINN